MISTSNSIPKELLLAYLSLHSIYSHAKKLLVFSPTYSFCPQIPPADALWTPAPTSPPGEVHMAQTQRKPLCTFPSGALLSYWLAQLPDPKHHGPTALTGTAVSKHNRTQYGKGSVPPADLTHFHDVAEDTYQPHLLLLSQQGNKKCFCLWITEPENSSVPQRSLGMPPKQGREVEEREKKAQKPFARWALASLEPREKSPHNRTPGSTGLTLLFGDTEKVQTQALGYKTAPPKPHGFLSLFTTLSLSVTSTDGTFTHGGSAAPQKSADLVTRDASRAWNSEAINVF